ncbi:MAG: phenylalanine--tRNA ligase subunit alpha [Deltaproteobacteria bacterium]|nr:phenylalanine--tRNA ligase subunit alpha [Deltaproteobacteria bacterium]
MSTLLDKIEEIRSEALQALKSLQSAPEAVDLKVKYLGRKGLLTQVMKELGQVDASLRPQLGEAINDVKKSIEHSIDSYLSDLKKQALENSLAKDKVDISLPGRSDALGSKHPITQMIDQIRNFFLRFGFDVFAGPEIETDFYNFEALGIPPNHPARDMQDTFYLVHEKEGAPFVLRTHTSPVQVHVMQELKPPIRMIAPGPVYRKDSDISHTPMFHQIEGLWVEEGIHFGHLKGVLTEFLKEVFGEKIGVRFRPSYFPFTEPSAEVDIACVICEAKGCRVCKNTGWLEIMGCGMVDPVVFEKVNIDSEKYTGFAFGMGIERITMLKNRVTDIRLFFENDVRFLKQF